MQVINELLIQSPEFAAIGPHQFHVHVYGIVNVPADAASRAMVTLLHSVTHQLGIVAVQIPLPERALAFLNRALDAIQAAQMDEHPVPTPTRQVLDVAPQDLSEDDEVEWLQTLPAAPQVDAPCVVLADNNIFCDADYDSDSEDLDGEDLDGEYRCISCNCHSNRDTQDMVGNDDLARDDEVWEQPIPDIHHDSPPVVLLPRVQSQDELDRMRHLGAVYFGAEDQPLQFKFKSAFGSLSTPKMGEKKRVSQVHTGLLVVVARRRSGVLIVVQI
jgi:hypothetical protein